MGSTMNLNMGISGAYAEVTSHLVFPYLFKVLKLISRQLSYVSFLFLLGPLYRSINLFYYFNILTRLLNELLLCSLRLIYLFLKVILIPCYRLNFRGNFV